MRPQVTNVSSRYGAPMGRRENITEPRYPVKFHLQRIRLNLGGYDAGGAYWGHGRDPLYCVFSDDPRFQFYARGQDKAEVVMELVTRYPKVGRRFLRSVTVSAAALLWYSSGVLLRFAADNEDDADVKLAALARECSRCKR